MSFARRSAPGERKHRQNCARRASAWGKLISALALFVVVATFSSQASAQIVNTEPLFRNVSGKPLALTVRGEVDLQRGNTQLFTLGANGGGRWRHKKNEFLLTGAIERSNASGEQISNKSFGHLRYRYWWNRHLQWEVFGQIAQDRFRLISIRGLGGTGPRVIPLKLDIFEWAIGVDYMYEVEQLDGSVDYPDGLTRKTHRANLTSTIRLDTKLVTIRQTIFMQPSLADLGNIRVLHELDFAFNVTKYLSLTWTLQQFRDSIAPSDVLPYDNRLKGGIKLDL